MPIIITSELIGTMRPGICSQSLNLCDDTLAIGLGTYGLKLLPSGRLYRNTI